MEVLLCLCIISSICLFTFVSFIFLAAKVSSLAVTTDLDEQHQQKPSPDEAHPSDDDAAVTDSNDISSLSTTSIDSLVKRIVRHNEAAMTSLHAYLRQVNPAAAVELINKICESLDCLLFFLYPQCIPHTQLCVLFPVTLQRVIVREKKMHVPPRCVSRENDFLRLFPPVFLLIDVAHIYN